MKRPYETVIVFDGTLPEEVLRKEQSQIEEFFKKNAAFERTDVWGKRTMAYAIKKKSLGYYCLFVYEGEGTVVAGLERHIKLNERILRFLTVVRDPKAESVRMAFFSRKERERETQEAQTKTSEPQPEPAAAE
ncbi:MAG: 30S ribosomal protein S6 [Chitinispirillaceae bacterium]|nr:30S ribosomal protein S6 [Chitinispirillaceae bacterium]